MPALAMKAEQNESSGGRLVSADGRTLPLKSAELRADARGGLARSVLIQRFSNPHREPLAVTYQLPLPADGAVSGFAFEVGGKRIIGEVDRKLAARERFERAIVEGRTAALLEQERPNLFTQELGNVPPGAEVTCEVTVDQKLAWLSEGSWEWRFPTVVAPRYLGTPEVDVADAPLPVRATFALRIRDRFPGGSRPESASHRIVSRDGEVDTTVELASEDGAALDRDVVVRWAVAQPRVGVGIDVARSASGRTSDSAFALLTVVPPAPQHALRKVSRDLIVLLDTSGSMGGAPLNQARKVVSALIDTLDDADHLELIEFSSSARRWRRSATRATARDRKDALEWLGRLQASGGTEMRTGILEALEPLSKESQRQVVLVTDGLIGFENEVISTILEKLPRGCRVHTVGVGSGVNRALTGPAARAGRGLEVVIGLDEDAERAAKRLVAHTAAPQVVDLELRGSALVECAPARLPDLFAGAPTRICVKLKPDGGELVIRGRTAEGTFEERVPVPAQTQGSGSAALVALFAREHVEDLETQLAAGGQRAELDARIESVGLDFQIATRLTSWIAVSKDVTVDPLAPTRQERVPQMLPYGMSVEGLGLRAAAPATVGAVSKRQMTHALGRASGGAPTSAMPPPPAAPQGKPREESDAEDAKVPPPYASYHQEALGKAEDASVTRARSPVLSPRPFLKGKRILQENGELVFSFILEGPAAWDPAQRVTIRFADGSSALLELDASRSTRAGDLSAGMVVRVSVRTRATATPTEIDLTVDGETVTVQLD